MKMKNDVQFEEEVWLVVSNLTWGIWLILTETLQGLKILLFNAPSELKKYREVMFDGTEYWCKFWRTTDLCFLRNLASFHRLKNDNFMLKSKTAELNQNKNYNTKILSNLKFRTSRSTRCSVKTLFYLRN